MLNMWYQFLTLFKKLHKYIVKLAALLIFATIILIPLPVQAFGTNKTNSIGIEVTEKSAQLVELNYTINQTFSTESRGIFLALPKNQNSVWTEYEVISVQRSKVIVDETKFNENNIKNVDLKNDLTSVFSPEPYDIISEWNSLRLRVGKADRILELGTYTYKINIQAITNAANAYNFKLLDGWSDPVGKLTVTDATTLKSLCGIQQNGLCATNGSVSIYRNSNLPKPNWYNIIINQFGIFFLISGIVITIFVALWYLLARDPKPIFPSNSPLFEPPVNLLPWQSQFLINEGRVDLKALLLSYLLWLNYKKYVKITPAEGKKSEPIVTLQKELPNTEHIFLTKGLNKAVQKIIKSGFKKGILESKFGSNDERSDIEKEIFNSLKPYYAQKPISSPISATFFVAIILGVLSFFLFSFIQNTFLIGSSILFLVAFAEIISLPCWYFLFYFWGKMNVSGIQLRTEVLQYRYYIEKAEKLKLDFSNTPENGVQYYLQAIAYAAIFGLLPTFQGFIKKVMPERVEEFNGITSSYYAMQTARFYVPPSSNSGGGDFSGGGFSGGGGSW